MTRLDAAGRGSKLGTRSAAPAMGFGLCQERVNQKDGREGREQCTGRDGQADAQEKGLPDRVRPKQLR